MFQDKDKFLKAELNNFSDAIERVLEGIYLKKATDRSIIEVKKSVKISNPYTASILFIGTIFGEFIVSLSKDTAAQIFQGNESNNVESEDSIRDALCESLNMAAGSRLQSLTKNFQKMTITAPRAVSGEMHYPSVHMATRRISYGDGHIDIYFYLDEMKLDIAQSYKDSISIIRKANQELVEANEKLKLQQMQLIHSEKMASLGVMAAGVAHEINNPLSYVMSNTDILSNYVRAFKQLFEAYSSLVTRLWEKKEDIAKTEFEKLKAIEEETDIGFILQDTENLMGESKSGLDRIRAIVNGLKLFSRVDDEGARIVQINDEIKNTLQLISNELKYKCDVQFEKSEIPPIECVPGELGQVFVNLLINASQAIPANGGKICIRTEAASGNRIKIIIADSGVGIPTENLAKIFDPFFTTKPVGQGTGLGLAITHSIVKKHGGSINVESKIGEGTKFTIYLPIQLPKNANGEDQNLATQIVDKTG